jgi:uncharacterized protein involved in exopolysaccharide biosynthesis
MPIGAALGVKFFRYRSLIRRRWWVLALTVGLGLAYQSYVTFKKPRLFESTSRLNIREELIQDFKAGWADTTGNFFGTSIEQLKSPVVMGRAYERVKLVAPQAAGTAEISGSILPRSNIFTVSGKGTNPEFTQLFVDAAVQEFLNLRAEGRNTTGKEVGEKLHDQLQITKKELEEQKRKLQAFTEENNMEFWTEQGKSSAIFLSGLKDKQAQLQNELQRLENLTPDQLLTTSSHAPAPKAPPSQGPEASGNSHPSFNAELYNEYLRKNQELIQRQADYAEWSQVWKARHPRLQKIVDDIKRLKLAIDTIRDQNQDATKARIVTIQAELRSLEVSIETWDKKVREASRKDSEYQSLQSDVERTKSQIEKLIGSMATISQGTSASPDPWVVMQKASPALEVPRQLVKQLIVGALAGFVVGMIILLVLDRADDRLSSSTELLEHFSEPILGQIPNVGESRNDAGLPLLHPEDERYTYAEAFRSLRSSLIFMPNQSEMKTLLVTSAIPNEGKSTVASNLAITMAAAGAHVLLVDADLRRGDLAQLFRVDGRVGLSNILRDEVNWKSALLQTEHPTLSLIARGPVTNQSGELLLRPTLVTLLDEFKDAFDLIIFNTDACAKLRRRAHGRARAVHLGPPHPQCAERTLSAAGQRARPDPELPRCRNAGLLLLSVSEILRGLAAALSEIRVSFPPCGAVAGSSRLI